MFTHDSNLLRSVCWIGNTSLWGCHDACLQHCTLRVGDVMLAYTSLHTKANHNDFSSMAGIYGCMTFGSFGAVAGSQWAQSA